ncbi:hypothetical protein, conserved [Babesia bigemina]|uniref:AP2/ERF domain-containing protein n=1 Tax=Babesia bigemina TaxID=5866 RepID=A0A061D9A9_BABBI|nr:hypothetical protein, conserved [Babesia bigemina]CDR95504.1 hypothetical protein, conserved [Babesia bigemina]|eukprot:XP_012767690.1 hypothetical protein, conserved [Babesia bigemina]
MLALDALNHKQPGLSDHQEVHKAQRLFGADNAVADRWKTYGKPKRESSSQAFFFMYQMKLLNTLGLVKSVCRPWGTLPHGNDFAYHFHKIATTNSIKLLQCYESVFRSIYDRFDAEAADPENATASLWAKVEDVDYFKIIYRLECMRNNKPFDNDSYNEVLEQTMHNVELQLEMEQTQERSNFDEVPTWGKFNWESKNRQYSLSGLDDETALPSDIDLDIAAAVHVADLADDEFDNSDLINTSTNAIEFAEGYLGEQSGERETSDGNHRPYNTRNQNDFDKLVMNVLSKQPRASQTVYNTRVNKTQRNASSESRVNTRQKAVSRRSALNSKDDEDFVTELPTRSTSARKRDEDSRRRRRRRSEPTVSNETYVKVPPSSKPEVPSDETHANRNINVVSASVSYDKRQQRFMAQWKTREGTKHSKSFYAKRYATPLMARKHAELYKMYILQHRGKVVQDVPEPTYEQLAAQNFQALDDINISDIAFLDELD